MHVLHAFLLNNVLHLCVFVSRVSVPNCCINGVRGSRLVRHIVSDRIDRRHDIILITFNG